MQDRIVIFLLCVVKMKKDFHKSCGNPFVFKLCYFSFIRCALTIFKSVEYKKKSDFNSKREAFL